MCLYPKLIKNRKYIKNKKNGGVIPAVPDERVKLVPVGCGKCMECRKQKARGWQVRLMEEVKERKNGKFITLTFSNESIKQIIYENKDLQELTGYELDNELATKAVRLFLERWRKKHKKSVKHWLVTELGHEGTENIHMHGIIWTDSPWETIESTWKYGYIYPNKEQRSKNYVNGATVNYVVKYINKIDPDHKYYNSKILTSPGIGNGYMKTTSAKDNKFKGTETNEAYRTNSGHKISLPIYMRNKIYSEEEREKLWLQKLDKNERYVGGEYVAADNIEEYERLLEWHRKRNKRLGYGSDEINWDRKNYEENRRKLMMEKRTEKWDAGSKYILNTTEATKKKIQALTESPPEAPPEGG